MILPFVPWRDDCILPEESVYSVFSKVAWFQALTPARYWRDCRLPVRSWSPVFVLNLAEDEKWASHLRNRDVMPRVLGRWLGDYMDHLVACQEQEIPLGWRSESLRVCEHCLDEGVHLRLHQHMALSRCHVHGTPLLNVCKHCGEELRLLCHTKTEAFCCSCCAKSLMSRRVLGQPRKEAQRQQVEQATEQVQLSLRDLTRLSGVVFDARRAADRVWTMSMDAVKLECIHLHIPAHPALRRGSWSDVEVTTEAVAPGPHAQPNQAVKSAFRRRTLLAFEIAACRVARWFLLKKGRAHTQCLDAPTRMFGSAFGAVERPFDLLACCPVAVGFWFWRLSFGRLIETAVPYEPRHTEAMPDRRVVLVLYKVMKSHLQYCLYVAMKIQANDDTLLNEFQRIRVLRGLMRTSFHSFLFAPWHLPDMLIRFDLNGAYADIPCSGNEAYENRLRQAPGNETIACGMNVAGDYQLVPGVPFACMRFDRFFLACDPWSLRPPRFGIT